MKHNTERKDGTWYIMQYENNIKLEILNIFVFITEKPQNLKE